MGINIMRSFSSYDGYERKVSMEPDPKIFTIEEIHAVNGNLVAIVHYPHATNFEGRKILVFEKMTEKELRSIKILDPHFSENGPAPFARFEPTKKGLLMAKKLCEILN